MIGIGLQIRIKKSKVITDPARALALPLVEMVQFLASRILARVQTGQGPHGPWDSYGEGSADPRAGSFFWVAPGRAQPDGFVFRVPAGKLAGWAAYESIKSYYAAGGKLGRSHTFAETGELMRRAAIRIMSARHVRLAFYGPHGKDSAKNIAWLASRDEAYPLLMPSPGEVREAERFLVGRYTEAMAKVGALSERSQRIASGTRGLGRRASRLLGDRR